MASSTRRRVSSLTDGEPFNTRDTVPTPTPASAATAAIVLLLTPTHLLVEAVPIVALVSREDAYAAAPCPPRRGGATASCTRSIHAPSRTQTVTAWAICGG